MDTIRMRRWSLLACGAMLVVAGMHRRSRGEEPPAAAIASGEAFAALADPVALSAAFAKANADGKYRMLLAQIKVEGDRETVGEFKDDGLQNRTEYGEHIGLPAGYWVYASPYWYIWRDLASQSIAGRAWGPEQATGEPNTGMAGDIDTAWASLSQDGQEEWLLLEYAEFVEPVAIQIHETYNPGSVTSVNVLRPDGTEETVWTGEDPTPRGAEKGVSVIPFRTEYAVNRVKIYLDSQNVPGWNEIDAVGLRDAEGQTVWAVAVHASTTYAEQENFVVEPVDPYAQLQERIAMQDANIAVLQAEVAELKASIGELKELLKRDQGSGDRGAGSKER